MTATKFLAHCEECGHAYRVPHADRTYHCKECDGEVVIDEENEPHDELPELEHRSLSQRHHHVKKASPMRWIIPILAIIVMGGGGLYSLGYFDKWFGGEKDINVVAAEFRTVWTGGSRAGINEFLHPTVADSVNSNLDAVVERAGWTAGFGAVTSVEAKLTAGTADAPQLAETHLVLAGAPAWMSLKWQFEPSKNRWLITSMKAAPPALGPRVDQFMELWGNSSLPTMRPMFSKKNGARMSEILGKLITNRKWKTWPALSNPVSVGESGAADPAADLVELDVSTTFETSAGQITIDWGFNGVHYDWMVKGFDFPPL